MYIKGKGDVLYCWKPSQIMVINVDLMFPGTGSGLGTYVLNLLHDEYPDVYRFTTAVYPSADDDVITSPYNRSAKTN
jgi:hypothetical protein